MLMKLLSLLAAGKGGAVAAAVLVAGATTVGVATTDPNVQETLNDVRAAVTSVVSPGMSELAKAGKIHGDCDGGQPVVVAQRNAADKLLRLAWSEQRKALTELRGGGGKDVDHKAANEILRKADGELRDVLTAALNEVAKQTLGREGQIKETASASPSASPSPTASPSPSGSPTAKPSCTPKPSASPSASPEASASPSGSGKPDERGRAAVAARVTLDAALAGIVEKATADMQKIADDAKKAIGELEPAQRGKPSDKPGGKPSEQPSKPEDHDGGKPSEKPGGRPSSPPGRP